MWVPGVAVDAPFLDDHLCLPDAVEELSVEAVVSELAVDVFAGHLTQSLDGHIGLQLVYIWLLPRHWFSSKSRNSYWAT